MTEGGVDRRGGEGVGCSDLGGDRGSLADVVDIAGGDPVGGERQEQQRSRPEHVWVGTAKNDTAAEMRQ